MFYSTTTLAVLGLATLARSHMIMNTPVPYGKSTLTNSPLAADGSDFPCKQRPGVYAAEGASNSMALGSTQSLAFTGSATHGGGSCQVSITYDQAPTTSSTWKVIHSIEGGCPIKGVAGNNGDSASAVDPDTYSFTVPTTLPTGTATLAWTWFNKIGNREMYMNCAPVTLTASSSKRSDEDELTAGNYTMLMERDTAAYNALPNMFVANIGNGCGTQDSTDLLFPNPGDSVEQDGTATSSALATPTGSSCGKAVAGASASAGPAAGSSTAQQAGSQVTSSAVLASSPAASGGVFVTVAPSSAASATAAASPVASSATVATVAPVSSAAPVASSMSVASTPVASSSTPASTGTSTGTSGSGSAIAAGTACTTEGMWNCIGGTSFQQCASGTWSVVQQLAAGTSCTAGETTNINIVAGRKSKRSIRFSGQHLRRHLQQS